ncbi:MAG: hypothetical protein HDS91_02280 [Bacteroidales bacterium]|nr:hypothetical protein [Bacteroidales bacterium]
MILSGIRHICGHLTHSIAVVAAIAALALMSCSHDDTPDMPAGEDQSGIVAFNVVAFKTAGTTTYSRATWGDSYEQDGGDSFDTRLLKDQLYVYITDENCSTEYSVTNLVCTGSEENGVTVSYYYQGRIHDEDIDKVAALTNGKLHIIANAGSNPALDDATTYAHYGQPGENFTAIPMWGVKQVNDLSGIKDSKEIFDFKDVALLRSMAKVVIENATDADNYITALESVAVSAINTTGYLLPDGWKDIATTKNLDRYAVRIPEQSSKGPVFYKFADNRVEFYMPEILNPADDELKLTLFFKTKDDKARTGELLFRKYSDGEPTDTRYNLRRNYLYNYTVRMDITEFAVEVDVDPYTIIELDPIFGLGPKE